MNFKQTVLEEGMNIFQRHGIQSLSMEVILEKLDISKGTLRGIAATKDQLLEQCVETALEQRKAHFSDIVAAANEPVEAMLELLKTNLESYVGHHSEFLPDLKNHYPVCWEKMQAFSDEHLLAHLTGLLNAGIEQQLVKPEINAELVGKLLIAQTLTVVEAGLINPEEKNFTIVYKLAFEYYLRGMLTEKGLRLLENATGN